jgi:signal peptidase
LSESVTMTSATRLRIDLMLELLNRGGEATVRVNGSSMLPSIWPGDSLTVRRSLIAEVRRGDIALFTRDGRLFAHRVIAVAGEHVVTQGDAVPLPDAPVSSDELLGVVVAVSRNGREVGVSTTVTIQARLVAALVSRSSRISKILQRVQSPWRGLPVAKAP